MKFTKEEAVEKLNQILTNDGKKPLRMSKRTLEGQTETLMSLIATEEMDVDEFVGKVQASLASINSNIEHDVADSIKEYEKSHPQPDPSPKPDDKPDKGDDKYQILMDEIAALKKAENDRAVAATLADKRNSIRAFLSDNKVKDNEWIDMALGMTTISVDDDAEEKGKALLEFYNKSMSSPRPIVPGSPKPGDGGAGQDTFSEVRNIRKQRADLMK